MNARRHASETVRTKVAELKRLIALQEEIEALASHEEWTGAQEDRAAEIEAEFHALTGEHLRGW